MSRLKPYRASKRVGKLSSLAPVSVVEVLPASPRGTRLLDLVPETVKRWEEVVSRQRAMRAWRLLQRGVYGTLPELLTYDWLESRRRQFEFQTSLLGGRRYLGGAVADFIIFDLLADGLVVWRIQGDYWHSLPERIERDMLQRQRLLNETYEGAPIVLVVDIFESAVYTRAPSVFEDAEVGVEIGKASVRRIRA